MRAFEKIMQTTFFVSLASYATFWILDMIFSGFVSDFFSVHIFLLSAIASGVVWSWAMKEYGERAFAQLCCAVVMGIFLFIVVLSVCKGESYCVLLALISFITPTIVWSLLK
jgi:hypothetical protein